MTLLSLDEILCYLNDTFDLVFCPTLMDTKKADLESFSDREIAFTLFNGAIRTHEDIAMAHLLRSRSRTLVAFGSCAHEGCVLGLANLWSARDSGGKTDADGLTDSIIQVREGTVRLPRWNHRLTTLAQEVPVDFILPGCPPERDRVAELFLMMTGAADFPAAGSIVGGSSAVCTECPRARGFRTVSRFYRIHEKVIAPELCLIDQGIICMGIATRNGCGCRCPQANMPCTGCYGPPEGVADQGAAMISALASVIDIGPANGLSPEMLTDRIDEVLATVPDCIGTFWKYSYADSLLGSLPGRKR